MYPNDVDGDLASELVDHRARDLGVKVQLLLAPLDDSGAAIARKAKVPEAWVRSLGYSDIALALAELGWETVETLLPRTVAALRERVGGLGILLALDEQPSLLYFFVGDEDVAAYEGLPPKVDVTSRSQRQRQKPLELTMLQVIHDGWFEFYSGELGWMPEEDWEVMGEKGDTLTAVSMNGSAMAGYETLTLKPYVLYPDEERVELADSLAKVLDEWSVDGIFEDDDD